MVTFTWSEMDRSDRRVLQLTPKHTLGDWGVVNKPNAGVGQMDVILGDAPVPPRAIHRMMMVENVASVIAMQGMFVVVVKDETRWLGVQPEIESILAIELEGHLDDVGNAT